MWAIRNHKSEVAWLGDEKPFLTQINGHKLIKTTDGELFDATHFTYAEVNYD